MRNIRLTIQYDGTCYSGWQIQESGATIQGLLEQALQSIIRENVRVTGAARTDAGVHAIDQVAAFSTSSSLTPDVFMRALNASLPRDIRVIAADEAPGDFHPRYSAKNKIYSYLISRTGIHSVFLHRYSWALLCRLDLDLMRDAALHLTGRHDFSSFRASGCGAKNPVREIQSITIEAHKSLEFMTFSFDAPVIKISVRANAFLRHMVRNIVGTLAETGRGKAHPEEMKEILAACDRRRAGRTAPSCGLFLEKIEY